MTSPLVADPNTTPNQDGLTDYEEDLLSTNPNMWTRNGDWITDTLEIQGYYGTRTCTPTRSKWTQRRWHDDGREWNLLAQHMHWDWDDEGTPDLFDRDDDNDGVPDNLDMCRTRSSRQRLQGSTFLADH